MSRPYDSDPTRDPDPYERFFRAGNDASPDTDGRLGRTAVVGRRGDGGSRSARHARPAPPPRVRRSRAPGRPPAGGGDEPGGNVAGHVTGHGGDNTATRAGTARPVQYLPSSTVRRKKQLLVTAAMMSVIVLLASGSLWAFSDYAMSKIKRIDPFAGLEGRPQRGVAGAMNILIVGADRREGMPKEMVDKLNLGPDQGQRSDTMILAHISEHQDRVVLVSLPRDSLVTIPRHKNADGAWVPPQQAKLNAAYAFGGPQLAVATVEKATGVRIDHYVEVNFLGFVDVVDALGGVKVCTPTPINDRRTELRLPAGEHLLDGPTALGYVRARYSLGDGSDLGRIERQQEFLSSMLHRATSTGTLLNPVKLSRFLDAALSAVRADRGFTAEDMRSLALELRDLSPSKISFITVPISDGGYQVPGVGSSVRWDEQQAGLLFQRIKNDEPIVGKVKEKKGKPKLTIPPDRIAVQVYNAAGTPGLGGRTAQALQGVGFLVPAPAQNWPGPMGAEQTVIEYGPDRADSARTVQAAIPGSVLRENPARGDGVAVVVGSSFPGANEVQVSPSASPTIDPRTAAQNPCK